MTLREAHDRLTNATNQIELLRAENQGLKKEIVQLKAEQSAAPESLPPKLKALIESGMKAGLPEQTAITVARAQIAHDESRAKNEPQIISKVEMDEKMKEVAARDEAMKTQAQRPPVQPPATKPVTK